MQQYQAGKTHMEDIIEKLLQSDEPSVRFKVLVNLQDQGLDSSTILSLREEIRQSARAQAYLAKSLSDGRLPSNPYAKWNGAHWVLAQLADMGYPPGDSELIPLRELVLEWLFSDEHLRSIKILNGRPRIHASQEGNAVYALLALELSDDRVHELVSRMLSCQWSDGGWNCHKKPEAAISSFHESLIPMRALALHAGMTGSQESRQAMARTSEIFLKRHLFRRERGGQIMRPDFTKLCYPPYWHYDFLFGLKVMAEAGFIDDPRCEEALDLLESKRLPDGGWPAEKKYYRLPKKGRSGNSPVDWGGVSKRRMNAWVTVDALYVLKEAGRL